MWSERVLERVLNATRPVVLHGGVEEGVPFLLDALRRQVTVAWVALEPQDAHDFVAQGNRLAEAVNRAVGATVLPKALPYATNVALFRQQRSLLDPMVVALQDAHLAPEMSAAMADLADDRVRVVLSVAPDAQTVLAVPARHIDADDLALTRDEAAAEGDGRLSSDRLLEAWEHTRGRYGAFRGRIARLVGDPAPLHPAAEGTRVALEDAMLADPQEVFEVLRRAGDAVRALELAVLALPERVPEVLPEAGPEFQRLGLLRRLHLLLESLDAPHQAHEEVLAWRIVGSLAAGRLEALRGDVEAWLERHEAPELRARYAGVMAGTRQAFDEARRAAEARPSSLTLFQFGRLHPDPEAGVAALVRSVDLAEASDNSYDVVRNAGALAERLIHRGRYRAAVSWGAWALQQCDARDVQDGQRRLRVLNNWAFASILAGSTLGLEQPLQDLRAALDDTLPSMAGVFRSTLTALALSRGQVGEALALARRNVDRVPRRHRGRFAHELVRALLEQGDRDGALRHGREAADINRHDEPFFRLMGQLAHGMALALTDPEAAVPLLDEVMAWPAFPAETRTIAALYGLVASGAGPERLPEEVRGFFQDLAPAGLRALSGPPEAFQGVWDALSGRTGPLHLRVLGAQQVTFEGAELDLDVGAVEVLLMLAEHPEGLTEERLFDALFADGPGIKPVSLRVRLSRLRKRVPVSSSPYRLGVAVTTDLGSLRALVRSGRVDEAVELYAGPVLPASDAHGVRQLRDEADELIRQAVLHGGSVEATLRLAATLEADLTVWSAALEALPERDPRVVYARAQVARLRREFEG